MPNHNTSICQRVCIRTHLSNKLLLSEVVKYTTWIQAYDAVRHRDLKNKGWHFNLFFCIHCVTASSFVLGKDCVHLKYLLFSLECKYSHAFLFFSHVFYCFVPVNAKVHVSFLLNYVVCVILNWNYKICILSSEKVPDSCCYLWNILQLEFSNFPETWISLSGEHFPRIRLEKLSAFPEYLRIWINSFETQHCVNPRWILLLQEKKMLPMNCALLWKAVNSHSTSTRTRVTFD